MKILIISNMYPSKKKPYSGVFVKNQYEFLKNKTGLNVDLFAMKREFTNRLGSIFKYLRAFLLFQLKIFKKYDILHVHFFFPTIIFALHYKIFHPKTRIVVTFHGSDINEFANRKTSKRLLSYLMNKCDYVISVGTDLSCVIQDKLGRKPDVILSAGVDNSIFFKEKINDKAFDFIFVGSFNKRKGMDLLLQAIEIINNKTIRYCFVGSGELENRVSSLQKKDNITFLKNQSQKKLRTLYNKSLFFILPSRNEPFGLVASEALFCGTPAIVSNIGGLKEQVENNKNGFVVDINSAPDIVNIIQRAVDLSQEKYDILSVNAEKSNKQHSLSEVCINLHKIYKDLMENKDETRQ